MVLSIFHHSVTNSLFLSIPSHLKVLLPLLMFCVFMTICCIFWMGARVYMTLISIESWICIPLSDNFTNVCLCMYVFHLEVLHQHHDCQNVQWFLILCVFIASFLSVMCFSCIACRAFVFLLSSFYGFGNVIVKKYLPLQLLRIW